MDNVLLVVITALISGLLATVISIIWQRHSAKYNKKLDVFQTLMAYRYMIHSEESVRAINSVDVIFYENKNVRKALKDFFDETWKKPDLNPNVGDKYLKLLEEIANVLHLKNIHWDDIKQSYYPDGLAQKIQDENVLRKVQIENAFLEIKAREEVNTPSNNQFAEQLAVEMIPELVKNPEKLKTLIELSEQLKKDKNN